MRAILGVLVFCLSAFCVNAQMAESVDGEVMYLDQSFRPTKKNNASFIKVLREVSPDSFEATVRLLDNSLKMKGGFVYQNGKMVEHGKFTYYHMNGEVESEGEYAYGYKTGEWKRFTKTGKSLPSRFYSADMGARVKMHVLSKMEDMP